MTDRITFCKQVVNFPMLIPVDCITFHMASQNNPSIIIFTFFSAYNIWLSYCFLKFRSFLIYLPFIPFPLNYKKMSQPKNLQKSYLSKHTYYFPCVFSFLQILIYVSITTLPLLSSSGVIEEPPTPTVII